jgi:hypothetical protein
MFLNGHTSDKDRWWVSVAGQLVACRRWWCPFVLRLPVPADQRPAETAQHTRRPGIPAISGI